MIYYAFISVVKITEKDQFRVHLELVEFRFRVEEGRLNPYARSALVKLVRKFTGIPTKTCLRSPMVIFLA